MPLPQSAGPAQAHPGVPAAPMAEDERLRVEFYLLLAHLLARPPQAALLRQIAALTDDEQTPLGVALNGLAQAAQTTSADAVENEFNLLFIGLGRGELLPYGSHYRSGFLHDKPLAALRQDLARLGVARVDDNPEPEDHVAALCEVMAGMIAGIFGPAAVTAETASLCQEALFRTHIESWMPQFFRDLETAEAAAFYRHVGRLGRVFMQIEAEAFTLA